jgi:hypothetical protein
MAYRYTKKGREDGFPDEFGRDLYQDQSEPAAGRDGGLSPSPPPFWGYVTPSWFGPFLLSPRRRQVRGWC